MPPLFRATVRDKMLFMPRLIRFIFILTLLSTSVAQAARSSADISAALNVSALKPGQAAMIAVVVDVHPGLHAQSHQPLDPNLIAFELSADANPHITFDAPIYPPGQIEDYPVLGRISVYTGRTIAYVPLHVQPDAPPGPITLSGQLQLQACNDSSCFAPEHPVFSIQTEIVAADQAVTPANADLFTSIPSPAPAATQPAADASISAPSDATTVSLFGLTLDLSRHSFVVAAIVAFLAGIIFNVVPCVLPVLPVKAIGFYEASQHSRARSFLLGLIFSLGLVAVFAALGLVVLVGKNITWGQQYSNPWFIWGLAILLGALGFGMLGAFTFRLPTSVYGLDFRHDTLGGNFLWGALTAVLSTPCTAPLFPPVMIYAATLPRVEGLLLVIVVGCGMASPYLLLSAFPEMARRFPRTGAFAELIKQMMGFLLLGTAAFFGGQRLLGEPNQWWLVFAVVVWGSLYLLARGSQIAKSSGALCFTTALVVALVGGDLLLTLRLTAADAVDWQPYTPQALADARKANSIVLIDFTAVWCLNCKYIDLTVYHDPRTAAALKRLGVVMLKADDDTDPAKALLSQLGGEGIPYTAIYLPGSDQPVGLASIYTTGTLLHVIGADSAAQAIVSDANEK
jgi:suppressor for copper-sensitivity B